MTSIARIETFVVPPRWFFVRVECADGAVGWGRGEPGGPCGGGGRRVRRLARPVHRPRPRSARVYLADRLPAWLLPRRPGADELAAAVAPLRPLFVEEPLLSEHIEGLVEFGRHTTVPVALGERLYSRWDFKRMFEANCVDIVQPDLSHAGGISEFRRIAAMAEAYDVAIAALPARAAGVGGVPADRHVEAWRNPVWRGPDGAVREW